MSEIDHIVLEQYSWNQHNFGHSKSQLFVTVQFDFVMGKVPSASDVKSLGWKQWGL